MVLHFRAIIFALTLKDIFCDDDGTREFGKSFSCPACTFSSEYIVISFCKDCNMLIKRPLRDACLCMGDLQAPPAPAAPGAPHFVFLITL